MGQFIPNFEYFWPPAQGLTGWTIAFYGAGLDPIPANLKTVYDDQAQTTPIANPVELDIEGKCSVVLGDGGYKVVVRDDEGVIQDTKDNVSNSAGGGPGSETAFVETIEDLRNWTTFSGSVYVAGYYSAGDGGEGTFYWDSTVLTPDDGGYIIAPVSSPVAGRWLRIPDEAQVVRSASFGAIGTSSNRTAQMANANQYAAANDLQLLVNVPVTVGTVTFTAPLVKVSEGAFLRGPSGTSTYTFQGIFEAGNEFVFDNSVGTVNVVFSAYQVSNPYWFGGSPALTPTENAAAFVRWKAAGGGFMVLPPGGWRHSGTFTPSSSVPTRYDGKILEGTFPYVTQNPTGVNYPENDSLLRIGHVKTEDIEFFNGDLLTGDPGGGLSTSSAFHSNGPLSFLVGNDGAGLKAYPDGNYYRFAYGTGAGLPINNPTGGTVLALEIPANFLKNTNDSMRFRLAGYGAYGMSLYFGFSANSTDLFIDSPGPYAWSSDIEIVRISASQWVGITHLPYPYASYSGPISLPSGTFGNVRTAYFTGFSNGNHLDFLNLAKSPAPQ